MKRLIVTGDDFGFTLAVNEAVERAARDEILTCASLMVGAAALRKVEDVSTEDIGQGERSF